MSASITEDKKNPESTKTTATQVTPPDDTCSICYTDLDIKNTVVTPCDHLYCSKCFFKWLGRKETCALCRRTLLTNKVVEERFEEILNVQRDLVENYRYRRVLNEDIKKRKRKARHLTDNVFVLLQRQIRMRELLDKTKEACRQSIIKSTALKEATEDQKQTLELLKNYRKEWNELHTPLKTEKAMTIKEDTTPPSPETDINIVTMGEELNRLLEIERRSMRRFRRHNRINNYINLPNDAINDALSRLVRVAESEQEGETNNPAESENQNNDNIPSPESMYMENTPEPPPSQENEAADADSMPELESSTENEHNEVSDTDSMPSLETSSENEAEEVSDEWRQNQSRSSFRRIVTLPNRRRRSNSHFHFENNILPELTPNPNMFIFRGNTDNNTPSTETEQETEQEIAQETEQETAQENVPYAESPYMHGAPIMPGATAMAQLFARPELTPTEQPSTHTSQLQE